MKAREVALRLLLSWEAEGKYANLALQSPLFSSLSEQERGLATTLFYTAVERRITLDHLIGAWSARPADSLSAHTRALLHIGLTQLLYLDRIPVHAAVSETVTLAAHAGERSLVNAILRRAARERDALPLPKREKNLVRYLSVAHSFPPPLVRFFLEGFGEETAEELLRAFNRPAPLTLRVNTCRVTREALLLRLCEAGIHATPTVYADTGIRVSDPIPPAKLPGYAEGYFFVQDEASQLATAALAPRAGERVIDVCAAPGGKSLSAAIAMGDGGELIAMDLYESKCSLIEASAERLGLRSVHVRAHDATAPCEALVGTADRVICDVPCSGLGVLGKKPDLRYKEAEALDRLPALALDILTSSAAYLKAGGVLVYSTCTLAEAENRAVVDAFLREHEEFSLVPRTAGSLYLDGGDLTLLPHVHGTDGFYIAHLRRDGCCSDKKGDL